MATLTSAGAVNLTASTNWSPAQIPQAGDDLIIGAHTLTLDADLTLNSITLNNSSARLAIGGSSRTVNCTNGWVVSQNILSTLITTTLTSGMSVTLRGQWSGAYWLTPIATSSGGNLTLSTIGDNPATVLFSLQTQFLITSTWSFGTLTTIGRFDMPSWVASNTLVTMSGGTWNHTHTGTSLLGSGSHIVFNGSGTSAINWSGNLTSASSTPGGVFVTGGSSASAVSGVIKRTAIGPTNLSWSSGNMSCVLLHSGSATLTVTGTLCSLITSRVTAIIMSGTVAACRVNWRNQSISVPSSDAVIVNVGGSAVLDVTDLAVSNAGRFVCVESAAGQSIAGTATLITNTTTSAQACVVSNSGALDGKVVNLSSDILRIPTANEVAADADPFGYTASPITPTGLVVDPAVIAAAVGTALGVYDTNGVASRDDLADVGVDLTPVLAKLPVSGRALSDEDYEDSEVFWNRAADSSWDDGSFGDRLLISTNNQREVAVTGSHHVAADIHEIQPDQLADINAQVVDALSVDTYGELSAPPAATSSLKDKIAWSFMWLKNKATQTATQRKLYADDGTTVISTEAVSDDGTTYTKGEQS